MGEREMAADNKYLGSFDLVGIPPAPRGRPQIEFTFDIDANGIVNVSAQDKGTMKKQQMQIVTSGGLSKQDIAKMQEEAERFAEEDKTRKEMAECKNQLDNTIWNTESSLDEHRAKLNDELIKDIEEKLKTARDRRDSDDKSKIESVTKELVNAASQIGEKIYKDAEAQNSQNASSDSKSDETVDEKKEDAK